MRMLYPVQALLDFNDLTDYEFKKLHVLCSATVIWEPHQQQKMFSRDLQKHKQFLIIHTQSITQFPHC